VRWLWAHAGLGEPFEVVARVADRNPTLMIELSLKSEVAAGGRLDPRWKDLFLRRPDRFMVGTDTWVTSQWDRFAQIQTGVRAWLTNPRDIAEQIAYRNARVRRPSNSHPRRPPRCWILMAWTRYGSGAGPFWCCSAISACHGKIGSPGCLQSGTSRRSARTAGRWAGGRLSLRPWGRPRLTLA
jgi:hypothetical protein